MVVPRACKGTKDHVPFVMRAKISFVMVAFQFSCCRASSVAWGSPVVSNSFGLKIPNLDMICIRWQNQVDTCKGNWSVETGWSSEMGFETGKSDSEWGNSIVSTDEVRKWEELEQTDCNEAEVGGTVGIGVRKMRRWRISWWIWELRIEHGKRKGEFIENNISWKKDMPSIA